MSLFKSPSRVMSLYKDIADLVAACWWVGPAPDMAGCRVWYVPKLVSACCWVVQILGRLDAVPKVFQSWCRLAGGWGQGPGGSGAGTGLLVGGWCPDMTGCRAVVVFGLMSPDGRQIQVPGSLVTGPRGPRVGVSAQDPWGPGLMPAYWWVGLGPGSSGGQGQVLALIS